jgi:hypothetical protein
MQKGRISVLVMLALCFLGAGVTATATMIKVSPAGQMTTKVSGAVTVNFTSGMPAGYTASCPDHNADCGIISANKWVYPTGDHNPYLGTGIGKDSVTINLAAVATALGMKTPIDYFGLYWGSIDTWNTISFWDGSKEVASYTGAQVAAAALSPVDYGSTSLFVNFFANGSTWSSIELTSSVPNFESDNHAFGDASVPEPATMALMGIGLLGVSLLFRRRAKSTEAE